MAASENEYEVFLNFRGEDTRGNITDHLYHRLTKDARIKVFRDNEELRLGETISPKLLKAIENSKIAITILSQDYASSNSCLMELEHIMRRRKTMGLKVIPVFYKVEPADVRNFRNSFKKLADHVLRYDGSIVQSWKEALKEVADMKGQVVNAWSPEAEIVISIVEKVKSELKSISTGDDENLVGIDKHAREVISMIHEDTMDLNVIGICGEAGVGKTALAKFIYQKLSYRFEYRGFVTSVCEILSQNRGIEFLQEQLIEEVEGCSIKISNSSKGMKKIKQLFLSKKVLVLLDNVGDRNQMRTLMRMCNCFASGSTVLLTTRDSDVVNDPGVTWSYVLKEMDFDQSLKLFCKHAFGRDGPLDDFDALSYKVVKLSRGLPLSLEVIGSTLFHKGEEEWRCILRELEDISSKEVESRLKICYNALDDNQKQVFLDVACFLTGSDKGIAVHMWKDLGIPEEALEILQRMSLVKVTDDKKLQMHDALRELGRRIAQEKNSGNHNHINGGEDGQEDVRLTEHAKSDARLEYYLKDEHLRKLSDMKFLQVNREVRTWDYIRFLVSDIMALWRKRVCDAHLHNVPSSIFSNIRWLSWHGIPPVLNFHIFTPSNLIILDLSWSKISSDWDGWNNIKKAEKLKVLNFTGCDRLTRIPDLSANKKLERLILERCRSLVEIHESIGDMEGLIHLNVKCCSKLGQLPQMAKLKSLKELLIDETSIRQIPPLYDMKNMETLSACNCRSLLDCSSLHHLGVLKRLSLRGCEKIKKLPDFGYLTSLVELDISNTRFRELPGSIGNLKELRVLRMEHSGIKKLPKEIGLLEKLEEIHADSCDAYEGEVPDEIAKLDLLRILILSGNLMGRISQLPASLVYLKLHSDNIETVPHLSSLSHLRDLDLDFNNISTLDARECLSWIQNLLSLESLALRVPGVQSLQYLPLKLQLLRIRDCASMRTLDLSNLKCLTTLVVVRTKISRIEGLKNLKNLEHLEVESDMLSNLSGLEQLENLKLLSVESCVSLQVLPKLSKKLQQLKISNCPKLVNVQGTFECLEVLSASGCESLESISDLKISKKLKVLVIENCEKLHDLNLEELIHLKSVKIRGFFGDYFCKKCQCIKKEYRDQKIDINVRKLSQGPLPFFVKLKLFLSFLSLVILLQFILLRDTRMAASATEMAESNAALSRLVLFILVLVRLPQIICIFKGLFVLLWAMLRKAVKAPMNNGNLSCRDALIVFIHMYFPRSSSILFLELLNYIYIQ